MITSNEKPWEQAFSDMLYWKWHGEPPDWSIHSSVGFIEQALKLKKGAKVLDLGCSLGYHSIELALRGYDVTGLELSKPFLEVANQRAKDASVSVRFEHGDMTCTNFGQEFDGVLLWGNTFGMFSDEANLQTLHSIRRVLKKDGLALIDTQNYSTLPENLTKGWDFHNREKNLLFLTEGTKDSLQARFGFTVLAVDLISGQRHMMPMSWRLYLLPDLKRLISDAGLILQGIYGDDPATIDWKNWKRGTAYPYAIGGFSEKASKRILLCHA